jgi:hypothetical protein
MIEGRNVGTHREIARLASHARLFRDLMIGFQLFPGEHPIVPVRVDDPA